MAYELTCPSCQARLDLKDDAGKASLICPRCLNPVPHPGAAAHPPAATPAPGSSVAVRPGRAVPSVESEVKSSSWTAYFIILALTLLGVVGGLLNVKSTSSPDPSFGVILLLFGLVIVLTILILYPIGRGLFKAAAPKSGAAPGNTALRTVGIIGLLVVLAPVAFFIVFFTVCMAVITEVH